jgi:hypothetical protein
MALTIKRVHASHGEQELQVASAVPGSDHLLGDSGQVPKENSREDATLCEDGKHNREDAPESRNDEGFSSAQDDRAGTDEKQVTVAGKAFSKPALSLMHHDVPDQRGFCRNRKDSHQAHRCRSDAGTGYGAHKWKRVRLNGSNHTT